ncbi:unnamed protein product [Moneuplotes crassus]|uniref:Uncharacterized protein n=1 Tax=Euplotes crassus TaxID=5936 RepID=A0AAD1X8S6_EUPCR|nr:unnamed protein product [Moneuplotes crassus]
MIKKDSCATRVTNIQGSLDDSQYSPHSSRPDLQEQADDHSFLSSFFETLKTVSEGDLDPKYKIKERNIVTCPLLCLDSREVQATDIVEPDNFVPTKHLLEFAIKNEYFSSFNNNNHWIEVSFLSESEDTLNFEDSESSSTENSIRLYPNDFFEFSESKIFEKKKGSTHAYTESQWLKAGKINKGKPLAF